VGEMSSYFLIITMKFMLIYVENVYISSFIGFLEEENLNFLLSSLLKNVEA
jgi:hypothetical protein